MSLREITGLLILARGHIAEGWLTADMEWRLAHWRRAADYRTEAGVLAADTQPRVVHEQYGTGVVVGVTADGLLEVVFAYEPHAVALAETVLTEVEQ